MALVVFKGFPTPPSHFLLREMKRSTLFLSRVKIEDWCQSFWDDNIMASIWGYDTGIDDRIKLLFSPDPVIRRVTRDRDIDHIMTAVTWLQGHDCSVLGDSLWGIKTWWLSVIRSYVAVCSLSQFSSYSPSLPSPHSPVPFLLSWSPMIKLHKSLFVWMMICISNFIDVSACCVTLI